MNNYYENPSVTARMIEFLGGLSLKEATCVYLSRCDTAALGIVTRPPTDLHTFLNAGLDVGRSLWDRASLIADLDIEYVNFDFPAEPYLDPERCFEIQRPVERAVERALLEHGITALHLISGRGHHFVWRMIRGSSCFERLVQIGRIPISLQRGYAEPQLSVGECVEPDLGAAFSGLGMVMEYVAHRIKEAAASECKVPVQLTEILAGPVERGREIVSIDLSEYGDPLQTRMIRVPFSLYLKPTEQRDLMGREALARIPQMFLIPLHKMDARQGSLIMRNPSDVAKLASQASVQIPDQSISMERLVTEYMGSPLARFHDWFYSQEYDPPKQWSQAYASSILEELPPCARIILEQPNDLLLKPYGIEQIVRTMLALGWHPRHIAGLIRSKYERDYGWGEQWLHYDPGSRTDFFVRLFSGFFVAGRDELVDLNCQSNKEKQFCFDLACSCNLAEFRESLLARRRHERLTCGPFNRLFLPHEHP